MKYAAIAILTILISCARKPEGASRLAHPAVQARQHEEDTILIRIKDGNQIHVDVSYDLENDSFYNSLIGEYIGHYEYGYDTIWPAAKLAPLVNRQSFIRMILLFYGKGGLRGHYHRIAYNGDWNRLEGIGKSLLSNSFSCCHDRYYTIADELLKEDEFDGAEFLWNRADLQKLPSLGGFVKRVDPTDFYTLANLAAFFHNGGHYILRDSCLARAERVKGYHKQFLLLSDLVAKNRSFNTGSYKEAIYGGD